MKRRSFLGKLLSLPAAALIPKIKLPEFIKASTVTATVTSTAKGIINVGSSPKVLWPGIYEVWKQHYAQDPFKDEE